MNVLLLVPEFPPEPGGIARSAARLVDGLVDAGLHVVVVTKDSSSSPPPGLDVGRARLRDGCDVLRFPYGAFHPQHWARELAELYRQLDGVEPHVVHAMGTLRFGQVALAVGRRFGAAVVYGMRGSDVNVAALEHPGRFASIMRGADALTAVSRRLAERAVSRSPYPRAVTIIPNAVPPAASRDRAQLRREIGFAVGTPLVGARLNERWNKGPERLLYMLRDVSRLATQPLGLCLFGADDGGAFAAAWRAGGDAAARPYRHIGEVEAGRVLDALSPLDLLVTSSHYEGMPNLMLEALSVGTPVAATPAGGCAEVLEDGDAGVLLSWDEAAAAGEIAQLVASGRLAAMRAGAQQHVETHYAPQRETQAVHAVYQSLVASTAARDAASRGVGG
ncbi:MAG: glycosyltransferase family 4 protein [bacterium]